MFRDPHDYISLVIGKKDSQNSAEPFYSWLLLLQQKDADYNWPLEEEQRGQGPGPSRCELPAVLAQDSPVGSTYFS